MCSVERAVEFIIPYLSGQENSLGTQRICTRTEKAKNYSEDLKAFVMSPYYESPASYWFLHTRFKLPYKSLGVKTLFTKGTES